MIEIPSTDMLALGACDENSKLHAILRSGLKKNLGTIPQDFNELPLWTAEYFGLHQTQCFQQATILEQKKIIEYASQSLLEEALYIEKSGMVYSAKMALLAESIEERMLYGLFAADETLHYHQVRQFLPADERLAPPNEFHHLLAQVIEEGSRESLVLIIQVVLEGWGLIHYKSVSYTHLTLPTKA